MSVSKIVVLEVKKVHERFTRHHYINKTPLFDTTYDPVEKYVLTILKMRTTRTLPSKVVPIATQLYLLLSEEVNWPTDSCDLLSLIEIRAPENCFTHCAKTRN